ncbi:hypothetical protein SAMN05428974_1512 [Sphingopyxis sp. YR583]|nr:hypothetical protein SAMN05428974_1512 [Sphingopyxis sp. YR583]
MMARKLTDSEIKKIVDLLAGWKGPLSWEMLSKRCEGLIFRRPARQTLARTARIAIAFSTTKDRLQVESGYTASSISMRAAQDRISRLSNQVAQLEAENRLLLEQFVRWQYNANIFGLSIAQLNRSLPQIDLRPT